jgi:hypothetical protein
MPSQANTLITNNITRLLPQDDNYYELNKKLNKQPYKGLIKQPYKGLNKKLYKGLIRQLNKQLNSPPW